MSRKAPELVAAVASLRGVVADLAEDIAVACGGVEQIRENVHAVRSSLQIIVNQQLEQQAAIAELQREAGANADFRRYVDARFELLHDQMIELGRSLGALTRDMRQPKPGAVPAEERTPSGRQRLETR